MKDSCLCVIMFVYNSTVLPSFNVLHVSVCMLIIGVYSSTAARRCDKDCSRHKRFIILQTQKYILMEPSNTGMFGFCCSYVNINSRACSYHKCIGKQEADSAVRLQMSSGAHSWSCHDSFWTGDSRPQTHTQGAVPMPITHTDTLRQSVIMCWHEHTLPLTRSPNTHTHTYSMKHNI